MDQAPRTLVAALSPLQPHRHREALTPDRQRLERLLQAPAAARPEASQVKPQPEQRQLYLLPPDPPDTERRTLREWARIHGDAITRQNPATVASFYTRWFGRPPQRRHQTRSYSQRELEILGLL